jgi:hypothetical protein
MTRGPFQLGGHRFSAFKIALLGMFAYGAQSGHSHQQDRNAASNGV